MTIYRWLIVALWLGLIAYWVVSSIDAKRSLGPRQTWHGIGLRLIVVALALAILAIPPVRQTFRDLQAYQARSVVLGVAGVVLCVAGVGLAALGRFYLGRNWGMPGSRKENPELITGGPLPICAAPDLWRHHACDARHGNRRERVLGCSARSVQRLLCLQRAPRRENHDRAISGAIPGLHAANKNASPLRILNMTHRARSSTVGSPARRHHIFRTVSSEQFHTRGLPCASPDAFRPLAARGSSSRPRGCRTPHVWVSLSGGRRSRSSAQ
jgi:hypothetical protein